MEFWETLFILDFIGMIILLVLGLIRVWKVVGKTTQFTKEESSEFNMWNWILVTLNILGLGIGVVTFIIQFAQTLLLPLIGFIAGMFSINVIFFVVQFIYTLKDQARQTVEAYNPENFRTNI